MTAAGQAPEPDSLRAAVDAVFASGEFRWGERPAIWERLVGLLRRGVEWLSSLETDHPVVYWLVLGVLGLVLATILAHSLYLLWRAIRPRAVAALPTPTPSAGPRSGPWHLAEALRLAGAGDYAGALAHRFLAVVLELDARRALRFHPSKTPAEYVPEARLDAPGRERLGALVAVLYRHLFGGARCDADTWLAFDRGADDLMRHVAPA